MFRTPRGPAWDLTHWPRGALPKRWEGLGCLLQMPLSGVAGVGLDSPDILAPGAGAAQSVL